MGKSAKYLLMVMVMGLLWWQTTATLLAQGDPTPDGVRHDNYIYLPMVGDKTGVGSADYFNTDESNNRSEAPRDADGLDDEPSAFSEEAWQEEADAGVTDMVQSAAVNALYWTNWVSEEGGSPPAYCYLANQGAVGAGCSGNNCDYARLYCETFPYGITADENTNYWTRFYSEEGTTLTTYPSGWFRSDRPNYEVCNRASTGGIVQGMRCTGSNCDNISLECSVPVRWVNGVRDPASMTSCSWTGWYSEEQGSKDFGFNRYITGVECSGSRCDNKRYLLCSLAP